MKKGCFELVDRARRAVAERFAQLARKIIDPRPALASSLLDKCDRTLLAAEVRRDVVEQSHVHNARTRQTVVFIGVIIRLFWLARASEVNMRAVRRFGVSPLRT